MRLFTDIAAILSVAAATLVYPQFSSADSGCREECRANVCRQVCVETEGRAVRHDHDDEVRVERREYREDRYDRRDERDPALRLQVPGVDVEVGR